MYMPTFYWTLLSLLGERKPESIPVWDGDFSVEVHQPIIHRLTLGQQMVCQVCTMVDGGGQPLGVFVVQEDSAKGKLYHSCEEVRGWGEEKEDYILGYYPNSGSCVKPQVLRILMVVGDGTVPEDSKREYGKPIPLVAEMPGLFESDIVKRAVTGPYPANSEERQAMVEAAWPD